MKNLYILLFSFALLADLCGRNVKTPQSSSFYHVRYAVGIYKEKHSGNLPKSWKEFINSGILSGDILTNSRRFLDMESRYIFVDLKPIQIGNQIDRIIIMARQAGGEGDNEDAEDPERRRGRLLIVEASDGSIQTRKCSESMLKIWFEKAGLNLADFTSAAPPPIKFIPPTRDPNTEGLVLGGAETRIENNHSVLTRPSKREGKPRSTHSENETDSIKSSSWGVWIAIGLATIGIFASAWSFWKFFRKHPSVRR